MRSRSRAAALSADAPAVLRGSTPVGGKRRAGLVHGMRGPAANLCCTRGRACTALSARRTDQQVVRKVPEATGALRQQGNAVVPVALLWRHARRSRRAFLLSDHGTGPTRSAIRPSLSLHLFRAEGYGYYEHSRKARLQHRSIRHLGHYRPHLESWHYLLLVYAVGAAPDQSEHYRMIGSAMIGVIRGTTPGLWLPAWSPIVVAVLLLERCGRPLVAQAGRRTRQRAWIRPGP